VPHVARITDAINRTEQFEGVRELTAELVVRTGRQRLAW
jgi:hypothetical protein